VRITGCGRVIEGPQNNLKNCPFCYSKKVAVGNFSVKDLFTGKIDNTCMVKCNNCGFTLQGNNKKEVIKAYNEHSGIPKY
jgi:transcription elongation factor Elf1